MNYRLVADLLNIGEVFGLIALCIASAGLLFVRRVLLRGEVKYMMEHNMFNPEFDFDKYIGEYDLWE